MVTFPRWWQVMWRWRCLRVQRCEHWVRKTRVCEKCIARRLP